MMAVKILKQAINKLLSLLVVVVAAVFFLFSANEKKNNNIKFKQFQGMRTEGQSEKEILKNCVDQLLIGFIIA